jgi:hypothetical protein
MRRSVLSAFAICVCSTAVGCGASHHERPAIARAVRATLADYIRGRVRAFCSDFTPAVALRLVPRENDCQSSVAHALAPQPGQATFYAPLERPSALRISKLSWRGSLARLTSTWPWPDILRTVDLRLEKLRGRWVIATPTHLVEEHFCSRLFGQTSCGTAYGVRFGDHVPPSMVSVEPKQPCHRHVGRGGVVWETGSCSP